MITKIRLFRAIFLAIVAGTVILSAENPIEKNLVDNNQDHSEFDDSDSNSDSEDSQENITYSCLTCITAAHRYLKLSKSELEKDIKIDNIKISNEVLSQNPVLKKMMDLYQQMRKGSRQIRNFWSKKYNELDKLIGNLQSKELLTIGVKENGEYIILDPNKPYQKNIPFKCTKDGIWEYDNKKQKWVQLESVLKNREVTE